MLNELKKKMWRKSGKQGMNKMEISVKRQKT